MPVEDVFSISGRTVVTRSYQRSIVKVGESRSSVLDTQNHLHRRGNVPQAQRPDQERATTSASCCAAPSEDVQRGQVLCKPGTIKPPHFTEIYVLSRTVAVTPFFNNYRPPVLLPHDGRDRCDRVARRQEMVMPGDNVSITVKLKISRSRWKKACATAITQRCSRTVR
jgi:elongation factor Tu